MELGNAVGRCCLVTEAGETAPISFLEAPASLFGERVWLEEPCTCAAASRPVERVGERDRPHCHAAGVIVGDRVGGAVSQPGVVVSGLGGCSGGREGGYCGDREGERPKAPAET